MEMKGKTFRLPAELIAAISQRAKKEGRTDSQLARLILERGLSTKRRKARKAA